MASGRRRQEIPFDLTADNRTQAAFRQVRNEVNAINRLGRSVAGTFGVAFGAAAIREAGRGFRELVRDLDESAKSARELNFEISELAELSFGSEIIGVEADRLQRALRRLETVTGQALLGNVSGEVNLAEEAFRALGFTLDDLRNLTAQQRFFTLIDALSRVRDEGEQAAIATQLFGQRLSGSVLRFAEAGTQTLASLANEASQFGVATDELAEKTEALNDGFARVNQASFGRVLEQLNQLLPPAVEITEAFRSLAVSIRDFSLLDFITDLPGDILQAGLNLGDRFADALGIESTLAQEFDALRNLTEGFQIDPSDFIGDTANAAEDLNTSFRETLRLQQEQKDNAQEIARIERERAQQVRESNRLLRDLESISRTAQQAGVARTGTQAEFQAALARGGQPTDPAVAELESILDVLRRQRTDDLLQSILDRIEAGALDNPVFS